MGSDMDPAEMQRHLIDAVDPEFLTRFPIARLAQIYEFDNQVDADAARALLLSVAFIAGERVRVQRIEWNGRQRVLAIPN
jgi:hypothetical protein